MIKEHNNSTWQGKAYSKIVDTTQQVASFPVVIRPMENTIPSWTIKGNMQQIGTPTPQNPITPIECGERTGNLLNPSDILYNMQFDTSLTPPAFVQNDTINCSNYIPVTSGTYLRMLNNVATGNWFYEFDANKNYLRTKLPGEGRSMVISNDASYIVFNFLKTVDINKYMFARTSTPIPYEPYGYKIPISSANTTTPVYLGEVESTRRIKKLVLTGQENLDINNSCFVLWFNSMSYPNPKQELIYCTHYEGRTPTYRDSLANGQCMITINQNQITIKDLTYATVEDFKSYLAAQYAAGTPVTVWYVLATPETAVVNEPLRKIGNYSDSVSGTNLSVTAQSPTTIDVDTSLKPSEMDLTYTGTKMCKRKKHVNRAWV